MILNPKSPFSDRRLSDLTGEHVREGDAWVAKLLGFDFPQNPAVPHYGTDCNYALSLMEHECWPLRWYLAKNLQTFSVYDSIGKGATRHVVTTATAPLAIRNAFIIAGTNLTQQEK